MVFNRQNVFFVFFCAALAAFVLSLPYQSTLFPIVWSSLPSLIFQNALLYAGLIWLGLHFAHAADLPILMLSYRPQWLRDWFIPGMVGGSIVGLSIVLLDHTFFVHTVTVAPPAALYGLLAAPYGAIVEELFARLFCMSLFIVITRRMAKPFSPRAAAWIGIVLAALLFGLGHLPAAYSIGLNGMLSFSRIMLLNTWAGIVFGWLYWQKGLETAMLAHFVADVILHAGATLINS